MLINIVFASAFVHIKSYKFDVFYTVQSPSILQSVNTEEWFLICRPSVVRFLYFFPPGGGYFEKNVWNVWVMNAEYFEIKFEINQWKSLTQHKSRASKTAGGGRIDRDILCCGQWMRAEFRSFFGRFRDIWRLLRISEKKFLQERLATSPGREKYKNQTIERKPNSFFCIHWEYIDRVQFGWNKSNYKKRNFKYYDI